MAESKSSNAGNQSKSTVQMLVLLACDVRGGRYTAAVERQLG